MFDHTQNLPDHNSIVEQAVANAPYSRESMSPVQTRALKKLAIAYRKSPKMTAYELRNLFEHGPDFEPGPPEPEAQSEPEPEAQSEPEPAPKKTRTKKPSAQTTDAQIKALRDLIATLVAPAPSIDTDQVLDIVKGEIAKIGSVPTELKINISGATKSLPKETRHRIFNDVLTCIACREHVYLVGPAGSGKTTLASQLANALDLQFYMTGAIMQKYELEGFIDPVGEYRETTLYKAYTQGGLYLFDEIDASSANAMCAFNAVLANGQASFPCGTVKAHKDFVCVAAANTFGLGASREYVGRNQLDAASLDRFCFIEMAYDETLERQIAGNDDWVGFVQSVRKSVTNLKLRHVVSPRASIKGAKLLAAGMERAKVENMLLWRNLDTATLRKVKAGV